LTDTETSLAKLWTSFRELSAAVWGDDVRRDNGLRSRVETLEQNLDTEVARRLDNEARIQHYMDRERQETCYGTPLWKQHMEDHEAMVNLNNNMKKERLQSLATLGASLLTLVGVIYMAYQNAQAMIMVAKISAGALK
jgi:hypothetical protein